MIRVVAVRYALEVCQSAHDAFGNEGPHNFFEPGPTIIRHPVTSLEAPIAIRIKLSVQNLLAFNSTLLAFFFVGFALHVVENSSVCARDNNA
jgi:hypothetical protein